MKTTIDLLPYSNEARVSTILNAKEFLNSRSFVDLVVDHLTKEIAETFVKEKFKDFEPIFNEALQKSLVNSVSAKLLPDILKHINTEAIANMILLNVSKDIQKNIINGQT